VTVLNADRAMQEVAPGSCAPSRGSPKPYRLALPSRSGQNKASVIIRRCSISVAVAFKDRQFITVNYYFWLGCRGYLLGGRRSGSRGNLGVEAQLRQALPAPELPVTLIFVHDG
jgi:hypothetical protein